MSTFNWHPTNIFLLNIDPGLKFYPDLPQGLVTLIILVQWGQRVQISCRELWSQTRMRSSRWFIVNNFILYVCFFNCSNIAYWPFNSEFYIYRPIYLWWRWCFYLVIKCSSMTRFGHQWNKLNGRSTCRQWFHKLLSLSSLIFTCCIKCYTLEKNYVL